MKEKKKEGHELKKDAKLGALKDMRKMASDMMGEGIKGLMDAPKSQVTVAADNPKDLKAGLDKAKEMVPSLNDYMKEHEDSTRHDSRIMEQGDEGDETEWPDGDDNEELPDADNDDNYESEHEEGPSEHHDEHGEEDEHEKELMRQLEAHRAAKKRK